MKFKWLKRIKEYYEDKALAEKCGMVYKDICPHDFDDEKEVKTFEEIKKWKCKKCGHLYDGF
jgi:hypothetical protein